MKVKKGSLYGIASIIGIILVLEILTRLFAPESRYIIPPSHVFMAYKDALSDNLIVHLGATIARTLIGFFISGLLGIAFGVMLGRITWLRMFFQPFIDLFRPLPSSAIIPAAMMIIGLKESTYMFIIVFGGIWPILINTISGVKEVDPGSRATIKQLGLKPITLLKKFILPEAALEIFSGLKISLSICLILAVTAEIIMGFTSGIGQFLNNVEAGGNYELMYFSIIIIALVGYLLNNAFIIIEKNHKWLKYKYVD